MIWINGGNQQKDYSVFTTGHSIGRWSVLNSNNHTSLYFIISFKYIFDIKSDSKMTLNNNLKSYVNKNLICYKKFAEIIVEIFMFKLAFIYK